MGEIFGLFLLCIIFGIGIEYLVCYKEGITINTTNECPIIQFTNEQQTLNFLIDTGANISYIHKDALPGLRYKPIEGNCSSFTSETSSGGGKIFGWINLNFYFRDTVFNDDFAVIDMPVSDINDQQLTGVLGSAFLLKYKGIIDFDKELFYPDLK